MTKMNRVLVCVLSGLLLGMSAGGCASGSSDLNPSSDRNLRKPRKTFMADAAARAFPDPAPKAVKAPMRGEVDYFLHVINIVNLTDTPWENVDVWINQKYVCHVVRLAPRRQEGVNFEVFYDKDGKRAPMRGVWVEKVQLVTDGKVYDLPLFAAD